MNNSKKFPSIFFLSLALIVSCREKKDDPFLVPDQIPAPEDNKITKKRTELGKFLFFDPGLSGINSPTIVNVAFGDLQFWDGRAISLESQATGPITFRVK